ncbi:MAG: SCO family protein [Pseudomonadota bacterium]
MRGAGLAAAWLLAASALVATPSAATLPFPAQIGGAFTLTDHTGAPRTERDPKGHPQLVFFGYATCEQICSVALPVMAEAAALAEAEGLALTPVMITVDPDRDTPAAMAQALARHHAGFVGLTGDQAALQHAYDLFGVESSVVFIDPVLGPIYAHGSFIYLLDGDGIVLSVLPPILTAERIVEILRARTAS